MGTHAIASETIFPTANDIAATSGDGNKLLELQLTPWSLGTARNFVYGGFLIPDSSANLDISIPAGIAFIVGYRVNVPGSTTVTCANSATNYIFLNLTRDGAGKVNGAQFTVNTTGTFPSNSVLLSVAVASGGAITNTMDARLILPLTMSPHFGISDTVSGSTSAMNSYTLHTSSTTIGGVNFYKAFRLKSGVTLTANMPLVMIVSETVIDIGGLITTVGAGPAGGASNGGDGSHGTDQQGGGGGGDGVSAQGGKGGEVRANGVVLESGSQATNTGASGTQVVGSKMMRNLNMMSGLSGGSGGGGGGSANGVAGGVGGGSIVLIAPVVRLRSGSELRTSGQSGSSASSGNGGGGGGGGAGNIWIHARLTFYSDEGCTFTQGGGGSGGKAGSGGVGGAGANGLKQIMLYG